MDYKALMGYGKKKKLTKEEPKPKVNKILESVKEEFGYVNETLPAFPREWKNLEKVEKMYTKAVLDLGKAVGKQDKKGARDVVGLYRTLSASMKKFKELLSNEILSKLQ